jgi:glutamate 5-kinase
VRTVIAEASRPGVLADALAGVRGVGTIFHPHDRRLPARKLWIAFAATPMGTVTVDDGARAALEQWGRSLLPAGVLKVEGEFAEGDPVEIADRSGQVFARGLARIDAVTALAVAGKRTADLPEDTAHEVVHRDDLVVLR